MYSENATVHARWTRSLKIKTAVVNAKTRVIDYGNSMYTTRHIVLKSTIIILSTKFTIICQMKKKTNK